MAAVVTPAQLEEMLRVDLSQNRFIVFIWGPPGVGKSTIVAEVAQGLGLGVVVLSTALEHPHVLGGMPAIIWKERVYEKLPPRRLSNLKNCVLFLDDFAAADPAQQRVSLSLTTYRSIGDHPLDATVRVVLASNRVEDASHIIRPSLAVMNRIKHYTLSPSLTDWVRWVGARGKGIVDSLLLAYTYAFLSAPGVGEKAFIQTPQELEVTSVAYPTPRSWFNLLCDLTHLLNVDKLHLPLTNEREKETAHLVSSAWVGAQVASAYVDTLSINISYLHSIVSDLRKLNEVPQHLQPLVICLALGVVSNKDAFLDDVSNYILPEVAAILASILRQSEQVSKTAKAKLAVVALGASGREDDSKLYRKNKIGEGGERGEKYGR